MYTTPEKSCVIPTAIASKPTRQNGPAPNFHHAFSSINPIPLFYKHKKLIALNGTLFAPICLSRQRDIKTCGMGSGVITPGKAD
ncbi:hypothetical protein, partial [Pseudomonas shahriarae]|uniref:hypothetical protein n=1 Tax=Pseudomonas shahriarae TaxID=2745512 RepID=UPI00235F1488